MEQICQSCSMPMSSEVFGTEQTGEKTNEYCKYCYENGTFTQPDTTMEEMIEICVPHMIGEGMPEQQARSILKEVLPALSRWKGDPLFVKLPTQVFNGISTETSNEKEIDGKGEIPLLWDRFFAGQSPKEDIIALYTNYTSDESGGYTFAIGSFTEKMEGSSFSSLLPESTYAVFTSRKGNVKEVVPELWNTIWNWKDKHRRTFTGDFEVYDAGSINPDEAQVKIYIAVKA
ncbi:zinc ribbon domain-containing protein [Bacillus gobiensis]|uniref:zinc ribbon domain-containing protein n=1 Tax=Bacillus gobiensis TaxID=1441095 RepID=UPI003D210D53